MGEQHDEGNARIIAWDDTVQEMEGKKVYPKNGLYWGSPQVAHLKWKCTGMPIAINKLNYQTLYWVKVRGEWHVQCDCIVLITVQSAENCVANELEVKSGYVDLFGVDSSQSQDDPPTPLPIAGRGNLRRGTRWTMRTKATMMMEVEASKAGDMPTAAEAEESARVLFRVGVSTYLHSNIFTWRNPSGCGQHNQDKFIPLSVRQSVRQSVRAKRRDKVKEC